MRSILRLAQVLWPCRTWRQLKEGSLSITLELLDTPNEHSGSTRLPQAGIEHCVEQLGFWPLQPEILTDELSSRLVRCVDLFDCLVLGCASRDQRADLIISGRIEKSAEDIFFITQEVLRASADNHRRTAGKGGPDCYFRNSGNAARVQYVQPVRGG